jgi:hypothetical protein
MTDAEDLLLEIANSMEKDFVDPAEHANWCVEAAKAYFTKRGVDQQRTSTETK